MDTTIISNLEVWLLVLDASIIIAGLMFMPFFIDGNWKMKYAWGFSIFAVILLAITFFFIHAKMPEISQFTIFSKWIN